MNNDKICLIITGCVSPYEEIDYLVIDSVEERERQYLDSLKYYIKKTNIKNIIFCDNSGYEEKEEIINLATKYDKKLEWLSFKGNKEAVQKYGKGYGEGEIMAYVFDNSRLLKTCSYFAKVTGRLKIMNFNQVMFFLRKNVNYFEYLEATEKGCRVDTRFFVISKEEYLEKLSDLYYNVYDAEGVYYEHVIAKGIVDNDLSVTRFPIIPNVRGTSGSTGQIYFSKNYRIFISSILRIIKIIVNHENY